jgi:amino acid transporter
VSATTSVQDLVGDRRIFVRNATGLVRNARLLDVSVFNAAGTTVIPYATGLFYIFTIFPRANLLLAILIGGALSAITWGCLALLTATMPRTGGAYIFNSRILSPLAGFSADWLDLLSSVLAMALWTTWFATIGLSSAFSAWGALEHSSTVSNWATSMTQHGWEFGLGVALTVAMFGLAAVSLKKSLRVQNITFFLSVGGLVVAMLVMLFTSRSAYIAHFNHFAQPYTHVRDSYHSIISQAAKAGYDTHGGYSASQTIGSLFVVFTTSIWAWSSMYVAGEMRGARSVRRQVIAMVGTGTFQILLFFLATLLFYSTAGHTFFVANNYLNTVGKSPLPSPPYYTLLAAVAATSPVLVAIILFTFVLNIWCGFWQLVWQTSRQVFAYSFDGILPEKFASVNERTHQPVFTLAILAVACIAMTAWATFEVNFFNVWAYVGLFAFVMLAMSSLSAIFLPIRRRHEYEASGARISLLGVPLIQILGVGSLAVSIFYFYLAFHYPALLGTATVLQSIVAILGVAASAVLIYAAAKLYRDRRGTPLAYAFQEIPPE